MTGQDPRGTKELNQNKLKPKEEETIFHLQSQAKGVTVRVEAKTIKNQTEKIIIEETENRSLQLARVQKKTNIIAVSLRTETETQNAEKIIQRTNRDFKDMLKIKIKKEGMMTLTRI